MCKTRCQTKQNSLGNGRRRIQETTNHSFSQARCSKFGEVHPAFHQIRYDSSGKNLWNPCMHLCNYSINKYHSDYIKCDDPDQEDQGHKWSLSALLRHLKANGIDTLQLMGSIEDVIIKVHGFKFFAIALK